MRDELEKLAIAGKIGSKHIEPLLTLAQGGYCAHKSWGFGRITTVDTVFCQFTIDFQGKPGHKMDLSFAAESLKSIPAEHILAKLSVKTEDLSDQFVLRAAEFGAKSMGLGSGEKPEPDAQPDHLQNLAKRLIDLQSSHRRTEHAEDVRLSDIFGMLRSPM